MTNEEKRWVNDMLEQVADISEKQVEEMVDEIPQASEDETSSDDPFEELAREVRGFADAVKDLLSDLGVEYTIVFGIGIEKSRYAILDGSSDLCKQLLFKMVNGVIEAEKKRKSERGEHEDCFSRIAV